MSDLIGMIDFFDGAKDEYEVCWRCHEVKRVDPHHVKKRSGGGKIVIPLCRKCHEWVETHSIEAEKLGLHVSSNSKKNVKGFTESEWKSKRANNG